MTQVGRLLAGWRQFKSNCGIAPVVRLVIPPEERILFYGYARRLMEGSAVCEDLRNVLVLVLLLRYNEVAEEFPGNVLTKRMDVIAEVCGVSELKRQTWTVRCIEHYKSRNSSALALSKVIISCAYDDCWSV
jgi:hypothetical protein